MGNKGNPKWILCVLFCFLGICAWAEPFVVVIDAGHGGRDPGAVGRYYKVREKDVNLDVALCLGDYITQNHSDVKVVYTRKTDRFLDLEKRSAIANKEKANLFISIHSNSTKQSSMKGSEVYTLGLANTEGNLDVAKRENSVILLEENYESRYEGFDPRSTESYIIFEMMQNRYNQQSLNFAESIQTEFCGGTAKGYSGVRQAGFWVLRGTSMPSVLIELGYLSNREEERSLKSHQYRENLAKAIYRAFKTYKNAFDQYQKTAPKATTSVDQTAKKTTSATTSSSTTTTGNFAGVLIYKIELFTSLKKLPSNSPEFKGLQPIKCYYDGKLYHYTYKYTSSYEKIAEELKHIKPLFATATLVRFKDGVMIK